MRPVRFAELAAEFAGDALAAMLEQVVEVVDQGRFPESDEALRAALKRWGSKAVNKEYDRVRN